MLARQFLTLTLSALIGFSPVNFGYWTGDEIEFPYTRTNTASWKLSYYVDDLGPITNNASTRSYQITMHYDVYCSSSCTYQNTMTGTNAYGYNVDNNHIVFELVSLEHDQPPSWIYNQLYSGTNKQGVKSETITYANPDSYVVMNLTVNHYKGSWGIEICFPALTEGMVLNQIEYQIHDFQGDYRLVNEEQMIYKLVLDKDVNSLFKQQVLRYLAQGDTTTAYNMVTNYYITNEVTQTENKETTVNNYDTHETNLQTVSNQEHQFTVGIENQFENQIQLIDPTNSVIDNVSWQQSAVWVTDKFNRFTNGNAFGSLLGFSLLIGFAMAIIGRVLK